jgi:hypothetical protein|tara:strand:- start:83 stop:394 length:312 start_codon:yes stop_codon:yes gene_type:complete
MYISIMDQILLYTSLGIAILALIIGYYAGVRVGKFIESTQGLEWDNIANITGDLATLKKTIQTLNNRINGMHSPKVMEQELIAQMLQNQPKQSKSNNVTHIGG